MKTGRALNLQAKFAITVSILLVSIFTVVFFTLYQQQKKRLIDSTSERMFSQLDDLVNLMNVQYRNKLKAIWLDLYTTHEKLFHNDESISETEDYVSVQSFSLRDSSTTEVSLPTWKYRSEVIQNNNNLIGRYTDIGLGITSVFQRTARGFVRIATNDTSEHRQFNYLITPDSTVVRKVIDGQNHSYLSTQGNKIYFVAAEPILIDGQIKGMLVISNEEDFGEIRNTIKSKKYFANGYPYLVSGEGHILIHPKENVEGMVMKGSTRGDMARIFNEIETNRRGSLYYIDQFGEPKTAFFEYAEPYRSFITAVVPQADLVEKPLAQIRNTVLIGCLVALFSCIAGISLLVTTITKPIKHLLSVLKKMARGEYNMTLQNNRKDEIGHIYDAINVVNNGLLHASDFAVNIGKGNFDTDFQPLSEDDVLGNALITMRNELSDAKQVKARRIWASEGVAQFSEIIRKHADTPYTLSYEVLVKLIEYTGAIQGAVFLTKENDNKNEKEVLEMVACYAYDRRKYIDKKVLAGEGFVGQVFLEQKELILTKLPPDYSKIAIGSGEVSPGCLLITPIKVNQQTIGVLEIASVRAMEEYQIHFINRICEALASAVASALASEKMRKLLEDAQIMTESLRSQEEEMRQNYEELLATQEELMRREKQGLKKDSNLFINTSY